MNDLISRQAAIDALGERPVVWSDNDDYTLGERNQYDMDRLAIETVPSAQLAQDLTNGCTDTISRAAVVDAIEGVDWYHQNKYGEMVHGANSDEHQAWYKAEDIYKAIEALPSAQPGWIPCSKKLPELNRSVLVQLSDDFVDPIQIMTLNISKCEGDFFYFWETQEMGINFEMGDVVAWMPLPTPWEGGQDGEG